MRRSVGRIRTQSAQHSFIRFRGRQFGSGHDVPESHAIPFFLPIAGLVFCFLNRVLRNKILKKSIFGMACALFGSGALAGKAAQGKKGIPECSVTLEGDSIMWGGFVPGPRLLDPPVEILKRTRPKYTFEDNSILGGTAVARSGGVR